MTILLVLWILAWRARAKNTLIDCNDNNPCTIDSCTPLSGLCSNVPKVCNDNNPCTDDICNGQTGLCQVRNKNCNDNIDCTFDRCDTTLGCTNTPVNDLCFSGDLCFQPSCDKTTGCVLTPKNCNDNDPCTTDSCFAGVCENIPHNLCNDNLKCTDDVCVKEMDQNGKFTLFSCEWNFDQTNCGTLPVCQRATCGPGTQDCGLILEDSLCPTSNIACLEPVCRSSGCGFKDICGASHPECKGCGDCSCNVQLNQCVKSCPSKRNLDEAIDTGANGSQVLSYSLLFLLLCLIFNRM